MQSFKLHDALDCLPTKTIGSDEKGKRSLGTRSHEGWIWHLLPRKSKARTLGAHTSHCFPVIFLLLVVLTAVFLLFPLYLNLLLHIKRGQFSSVAFQLIFSSTGSFEMLHGDKDVG